MNRRRSIRILVAMGALMIGAAIAFAHNGIEHVMGTVKSVTNSSITVETVKHTAVTVMIDPSTTFTNKDAKASLKDLKVGERVVINAKEGADKKLQAVSVKWGASPDMKMPAGHKM
jgi:GH25 family lysozyme M1 (1,4-beta-N-acetylmuramidase)